ncbi:glutaminyl-peptide cyclotransferase [Dietzia sp. PP-33]|jgi:glutamine cyclotransferase|uniref:glutaminyl-peptide cyclotransferase n=1 Tax=Dietzia sp. PP-33 TaxID=2957500 RepID=UPI0029B8C439|nr:glutaminyl-peptide cyclotransferase [Dietzia sp. PP-33]MDX2356818.1 glutaminyl-peptide cyclotransferase [Dietzia sp. PP-33]
MRSVSGPVGPLAVSLLLVGAVAACSATGSDDAGGTTSTGASLASSSLPVDSGSGSGGSARAQVPVGPSDPRPARGSVEVVRTLEHDPRLFTQGLQVVDDRVYESTGRLGGSVVQRRPLDGEGPVVTVPMADDEFGEGLAVTPDTLWTLTWTNGTAHNRDPETLEVRSEASYEGEGWGLCSDGSRLIMSDGSDELTFRDPVTFEPTGSVRVTSGGTPVERINELECADGTVLANVWMTDEIIRIDPATGAVTSIYDASGLEQPRPADPDGVLNGIAALPGSENVLLTGKLWTSMYEVRLIG